MIYGLGLGTKACLLENQRFVQGKHGDGIALDDTKIDWFGTYL